MLRFSFFGFLLLAAALLSSPVQAARLLFNDSDFERLRAVYTAAPSEEPLVKMQQAALKDIVQVGRSYSRQFAPDQPFRLSLTNTHPDQLLEIARALGIAWHVDVENRAAYQLAAQRYGRQLVKVPVSGGGEYAMSGRLAAMAILYDWFPRESGKDALRSLLARAMANTVRHPDYLKNLCGVKKLDKAGSCGLGRKPEDLYHLQLVGGHTLRANLNSSMALLAIVPDYPRYKPLLDDLRTVFWQGFMPIRTWITRDGGSHMGWLYGATGEGLLLEGLLLWHAAEGTPLEPEKALSKTFYRYLYGLRGNYSYPDRGDIFNIGLAYNNDVIVAQTLWAALLGKNPDAAAFFGLLNPWDKQRAFKFQQLALVAKGTLPEAAPLNTLPLSRAFRATGEVVMRSGWNIPEAALLEFKSTPFWNENHHHLDQNSFSLFYKAPLLLDSGYYDAYGSPHWWNYYIRSIAHNTATIFDTAEKYCPWGNDVCFSNDGGQRFITPSYPSLPMIQPGGSHALDGLSAYYQDDVFTFSEGNASKAYGGGKIDPAQGFVRQVFFFPKLESWPLPVAVIHDRIVKTPEKAGLETTVWLHTVNPPEKRLENARRLQPGVWGLSGNQPLWFHNGGGAVRVEPLLPEDGRQFLYGGRDKKNDYRFLVADAKGGKLTNFPPKSEPQVKDYTQSALQEPGNWRTGFRAAKPAQREEFLQVLTVADSDSTATPPASVLEKNADGVQRLMLGSKDTVLLLPAGQRHTLPLSLPAAGSFRQVIIAGLQAGGCYTLAAGRTLVACAAGFASGLKAGEGGILRLASPHL